MGKSSKPVHGSFDVVVDATNVGDFSIGVAGCFIGAGVDPEDAPETVDITSETATMGIKRIESPRLILLRELATEFRLTRASEPYQDEAFLFLFIVGSRSW